MSFLCDESEQKARWPVSLESIQEAYESDSAAPLSQDLEIVRDRRYSYVVQDVVYAFAVCEARDFCSDVCVRFIVDESNSRVELP